MPGRRILRSWTSDLRRSQKFGGTRKGRALRPALRLWGAVASKRTSRSPRSGRSARWGTLSPRPRPSRSPLCQPCRRPRSRSTLLLSRGSGRGSGVAVAIPHAIVMAPTHPANSTPASPACTVLQSSVVANIQVAAGAMATAITIDSHPTRTKCARLSVSLAISPPLCCRGVAPLLDPFCLSLVGWSLEGY